MMTSLQVGRVTIVYDCHFYTVHNNQTWQDRRQAYLYLAGDYGLSRTR